MKTGKGFRNSFSDRKFKMGGFQTLIMVVVIAVVIVLNLIVSKMNITIDLSSDSMYSLTEDTKKIADSLKDDIIIYYMCEDGSESITVGSGYKTINIENIVRQYGEQKHITVEKKDPVRYPNFAKTYTDDEISNNDVIVVNTTNDKNKHIAFADMFNMEMDYTSYQSIPTEIDLEGQITAAIQSLTSENSKKVYITSGHGEQALADSFTDILDKSNFQTETLETLSVKSVPEDCDILLVNGPSYDFTEDEYKMISSYLEKGGKAMFFLNFGAQSTKNYYKLLSEYGINAADGFLVDTEQCMSADLPIVLKPTIRSHDITSEAGDVYVDTTAGMTSQADVRSTLTMESLLDTSDEAYSRTDTKDTDYNNKNETDISGPFSVAMAVTDTHAEETGEEGKATKILIYGSPYFAREELIATNQYGNRTMLLNSLGWLTDGSEISTLAIASRSIQEQSVAIEAGSQIFWTALLVVILPLMLLIIGFVIWYRRRRS